MSKQVPQIKNIVFCAILTMNCSTSLYSTKTVHSDIRRSPQINCIDNGLYTLPGHALISVNYHYSMEEPGNGNYADTSMNLDKMEIVSADCYESRHLVSGDICVPFTRYVSSGVSFEYSFGTIQNQNATKNAHISKNISESALYFRLAVPLQRMSIGFRTELLFSSINAVSNTWYDSVSVNEDEFHKIVIGNKNILFARYTFRDRYSVFLGFQQKIQPYILHDYKLLFENAYGVYSGFSYQLPLHIYINPFVVVPITTDMASYRGPVQIGIQFSADFAHRSDKKGNE